MAVNGARGHGRVGAVTGRTQTKDPATGMWTRRDTSTSNFASVKARGGDFKGVVRKGTDRDGPVWLALGTLVVVGMVVLALAAVLR